VAAAAIALLVAGCPGPSEGQPVDVVRNALGAIARHDLTGAAQWVCAPRRDPRNFPFTLSGIFGPVGAMPGFDIPRTLSIIEVDVSALKLVERSGTDGETQVGVEGELVERFDPAQVEALFRAYAAESGQPVDQDLLDETIANVSHGPVTIGIRETVPLTRENSAWRICPPAPTP
jgi:hypothetical protein